jgi:hypothetical protein
MSDVADPEDFCALLGRQMAIGKKIPGEYAWRATSDQHFLLGTTPDHSADLPLALTGWPSAK